MWKRKVSSSLPFKGFQTDTSNIVDDRLRIAADRFFAFSKTLQELDGRIKRHYASMLSAAKTRQQVLTSLQDICKYSPIEKLVGGDHSKKNDGATDGSTSSISTSYYATIEAQKIASLLEVYQRDVCAYMAEWETTVSTRVRTELKHVLTLYKSWEKYDQKVQSIKATIERKKQPSTSLQEKLTWNEGKLRNAKREYRRNLIAVTLLTEEVTDRSWKDFVPLMLRMIDFDLKTFDKAKEVSSQLLEIRQEMVQLSRNYEMEFETIHRGRLTILREEDATDFVNPDDLLDLESTISPGLKTSSSSNPITTPLQPRAAIVQSLPTPPCSDEETTGEHIDDPLAPDDERESDVKLASKVPAAQDKNGPVDLDDFASKEGDDNVEVIAKEVTDNDHDDEDSYTGVLEYPRSIYVSGEGPCLVDDETTLTGMPDLASV